MRTITRTQAIHDLHAVLCTLVDQDDSLCAAVSRRGIFCRGFSRWSLPELRKRYPWIAERHPDADRETFVELANHWQRCRRSVEFGRLPCEVTTRHRRSSPCAGWDDFYESELARFHAELCAEFVRVVPDEIGPLAASAERRASENGS